MPFAGACPCTGFLRDGRACGRAAYYAEGGAARCGRHSDRSTRANLPKDPEKKKRKLREYEEHAALVEVEAKRNRVRGRRGEIRVTKIGMFGAPPLSPGFLRVAPNFKRGCADSLWLPGLSPNSTPRAFSFFARSA